MCNADSQDDKPVRPELKGIAANRRASWRFGVALPLALFLVMAGWVAVGGTLPFDLPMLWHAHASAGTQLDRFFMLVSKLGHEWGVVPLDVMLVVGLLALRRVRCAVFSMLALAGSGLLNMGAKRLFGRERPYLWESIAPEYNLSFPSGHAMGSMTLAVVLVLLAWPTRWRWWIVAGMAVFVPLVGYSRVYLGVHYPSDILAGWVLALAWVMAVRCVVYNDRAN